MSFGTNTNDNWYVFSLAYDSNVLLFGLDDYGSSLDNVYVYDENMQEIFNRYGVVGVSLSLKTGSYFINIRDSNNGKFSVYSKFLDNPKEMNPKHGSIINPLLPLNGSPIEFGLDIATNVFYFDIKQSSNVLISGNDSYGSSIDQVFIFDENMTMKFNRYGVQNETIHLLSGGYYIVIHDSNTGEMTVYSPAMSPNPIPPTHDDPYADGYVSGRKTCIDNPTLCGIPTYEEGYSDGNATGWHDGNISGYTDGKNTGYTTGYNVGYSEGNTTGYDSGVDIGWEGAKSFCKVNPSSCDINTSGKTVIIPMF